MSRDLAELLREAVPGDLDGPDLERIESRAARRRVPAAAAAVFVAVAVAVGVSQLAVDQPDVPIIDQDEPEEAVESALERSGAFDRGGDESLRLDPGTDERLRGQVIAELDREADAVAIAADRAVGIRRGTALAIVVDGEEAATANLETSPSDITWWGHDAVAFDTDGTLWALDGRALVGLRRDGTVVEYDEAVAPVPSREGGVGLRITGTDVSVVVYDVEAVGGPGYADVDVPLRVDVVPVVGQDPLAGTVTTKVPSSTTGRPVRAQYHVDAGVGLTDTFLASGSIFGEALAELDWQDPPSDEFGYSAAVTQSQVVAGTASSLVWLSIHDGSFLIVDREDGTTAVALVDGGPHLDLSVSPDGAVHLVVRQDDGTMSVRTLLTADLRPLDGPPIDDVADLPTEPAETAAPDGPPPVPTECSELDERDELVDETLYDLDGDGQTDRVLLIARTDDPAWDLLAICYAIGTGIEATAGPAQRLEVVDLAGTPGLAALRPFSTGNVYEIIAMRDDGPATITQVLDEATPDSWTGSEYLLIDRRDLDESVVKTFGCRPTSDDGVEFVELLVEGVESEEAIDDGGFAYTGQQLEVSYVVRQVEPGWRYLLEPSDPVPLPVADDGAVHPAEILAELGATWLCRPDG